MPPRLGEMLEEFLCGCRNLWAGYPNIIVRQSIKGWPELSRSSSLGWTHVLDQNEQEPDDSMTLSVRVVASRDLRWIHNRPCSNE